MAELIVQIVDIIYGIWDFVVFLTSIVYLYIQAIYKYFAPPELNSLDGKLILVKFHFSGSCFCAPQHFF